jgi:integration host factor subunit alpha
MAVTKYDLARHVRDEVRLKRRTRIRQQYLFPELDRIFLSKKRSREIVDSLFKIIKETLTKGDDVLISGFGKFQVKFKWARSGRNPRTGEKIILRSRRVVKFHTSPKLRDRINRQ